MGSRSPVQWPATSAKPPVTTPPAVVAQAAPKCSLSAQRKFYGAALPAAFTQGRNNSYLAHVGLELKG